MDLRFIKRGIHRNLAFQQRREVQGQQILAADVSEGLNPISWMRSLISLAAGLCEEVYTLGCMVGRLHWPWK
jgi:hypothetical protein